MKKKILVIANMSGFLWKFEMENARILQEMGIEVHFASNINEKGYDFDLWQLDEAGVIFHHIEIARSPYMLRMNKTALGQILKIIREERISTIHCHTPVGGLLGRLAALLSDTPVKVIYTAHGFHFYKGAPLLNNTVFKWVESLLARITDVMIVINQEDLASAQKMHLRKGGKVYYVPGAGVDHSVFHPVSADELADARNRIGIDPKAFLALSVGELNLNKNHKTVIRAVKQLVDENGADIPIIYGICGDGFFRKEIQDYARELNLADKVLFWGYQRDIAVYYQAADITIFPSFREGLGMAGIESLAMGIPVIAADNRGTREYMEDGKNGYVVNPDHVQGFVDGIKKLFYLPPAQKEKMRKACIDSVRKFEVRNTISAMRKIYGEWV